MKKTQVNEMLGVGGIDLGESISTSVSTSVYSSGENWDHRQMQGHRGCCSVVGDWGGACVHLAIHFGDCGFKQANERPISQPVRANKERVDPGFAYINTPTVMVFPQGRMWAGKIGRGTTICQFILGAIVVMDTIPTILKTFTR